MLFVKTKASFIKFLLKTKINHVTGFSLYNSQGYIPKKLSLKTRKYFHSQIGKYEVAFWLKSGKIEIAVCL